MKNKTVAQVAGGRRGHLFPSALPSTAWRKIKYRFAKMALSLALLSLTAASILAEERRVLLTQVPETAAHLQRLERLPPGQRLHLAVGLPLRNENTLNKLLQELYNPASTNFHRFLTPEQFAEKFGPAEQDYQKVMNYARSNGLEVERTFANRALVDVAGTVADIEGMFKIRLGVYEHPTEKRQFFAPDVEPTVAPDMPIDFVSGLDNYVIPRPNYFQSKPVPGAADGSGKNGAYLAVDLRNAYIPGVTNDGAGQIVGLVEFDGYTPSDILDYEATNGLPNVPLRNVLLDGVSNIAGTENGEVCLDIEMVIAMAPGVKQINVYEGVNNADVMNEIAAPTNGEPVPTEVSCSWGIGGNTNILHALLEMVAQGQSVFFDSGDYGAYHNATNAMNIDQNYVTVVGGTELSMFNSGQEYENETVWNNNITPTNGTLAKDQSSGGILTNVPIPSYQQNVNMSLNQGSTQWRNVPDVAMCADHIEVVLTDVFTNGNPSVPGQVKSAFGTSAATPLWAAFTALVNQQASAEGKGVVGFLNPAIYDICQGASYETCFNDITNGSNTNALSPDRWFAAPGYDLCTGWGSPKGLNLLNTLVGLTSPVYVDFNYSGFQNGTYLDPYNTVAQGVSAVMSGGNIIIDTAGSSSETLTISKRLTISASGGPATIGK
ncbi:MAG TPA: S53 family peptidase [Candidatus Baltobacteraceae bacterium]|nr:S53 family peptidase [Candidatus Baltobacteraceae bacterium]